MAPNFWAPEENGRPIHVKEIDGGRAVCIVLEKGGAAGFLDFEIPAKEDELRQGVAVQRSTTRLYGNKVVTSLCLSKEALRGLQTLLNMLFPPEK